MGVEQCVQHVANTNDQGLIKALRDSDEVVQRRDLKLKKKKLNAIVNKISQLRCKAAGRTTNLVEKGL